MTECVYILTDNEWPNEKEEPFTFWNWKAFTLLKSIYDEKLKGSQYTMDVKIQSMAWMY